MNGSSGENRIKAAYYARIGKELLRLRERFFDKHGYSRHLEDFFTQVRAGVIHDSFSASDFLFGDLRLQDVPFQLIVNRVSEEQSRHPLRQAEFQFPINHEGLAFVRPHFHIRGFRIIKQRQSSDTKEWQVAVEYQAGKERIITAVPFLTFPQFICSANAAGDAT